MKVRGPDMGCAVVMQGRPRRSLLWLQKTHTNILTGRYINHQALRALGAQERITMVTSFRPKDALYPDDSILDTVRPVSNLSDLYFEFGEYRLAILEERVRKKLAALRERKRGGKPFTTAEFKQFLEEQERFLGSTNKEIVP